LDFLFLPDVNFRRRVITKSVFGDLYKRPIVNFVERQSDGECAYRHDEHYGDEKRQSYVDKKNYARPASQINKLLEGQRSENFALYFYKLGDLKTHKFILSALYRGQSLGIFSAFPVRAKAPAPLFSFLPPALSALLLSFFPQTDWHCPS